MSHLVHVELVLPPRQLSVAGGELTNEVMAADNQHPHRGEDMKTGFIIPDKKSCLFLFLSAPISLSLFP